MRKRKNFPHERIHSSFVCMLFSFMEEKSSVTMQIIIKIKKKKITKTKNP